MEKLEIAGILYSSLTAECTVQCDHCGWLPIESYELLALHQESKINSSHTPLAGC